MTYHAAYCYNTCLGALGNVSQLCKSIDVGRASCHSNGNNRENGTSRLAYCDLCTEARYQAGQVCTGWPGTPSNAYSEFCEKTACTVALQKVAGLCNSHRDVQENQHNWGILRELREYVQRPAEAPTWYAQATSALSTCTVTPTESSAAMLADLRALRLNWLKISTQWWSGAAVANNDTYWNSIQPGKMPQPALRITACPHKPVYFPILDRTYTYAAPPHPVPPHSGDVWEF